MTRDYCNGVSILSDNELTVIRHALIESTVTLERECRDAIQAGSTVLAEHYSKLLYRASRACAIAWNDPNEVRCFQP
jgi:hypothetical protein